MGKLKNTLIDESFMLKEEENLLMEEAHYWALVDNVAQWMHENKSTHILDDIQYKVLSLYEGELKCR